ncbi:MAG: hypothetical protein QOI42_1781, partial [Frankiaceae bacterium]|nr:hypothetical protein [Frankiaceae bacterium]
MTATAVVSPRRQRIAEVAVPAFAAALVAAGLAGGHKKTLFALIGAICLVAVLVMSAHRERAMVAFLTVSMAFILHKSFGSIALENGGAPSFYLSTVGLCVLLLYGCWFYSGDMGADLRNGLRHVVFATPLVGMALVLPSLLVTPSIRLGLTELVQLGMLYLLFVYVAVRLSRRDAEMVLTLLGCLAGVELLAALGQWLTNGPLGLSFLGLPTALGQRITADAVLGRPFGTITHPVFLGAFVGQIGVLFLALAVTARRMWLRVAAIAVSVCTAGTIAVAQARSAALAFAVAAVVVVAVSLAVRRLQWRTVRRALLVLLGVAVVTSPMLLSLYHNSLGTSHFSLEVQARGQLLNLGWHIFSVHPLFGTGLNTFQQVMDQYTSTSLIFDHNPVHNIYVLQAAETGLVGVLAIPVVAVPLLVLASRSARSADRLTSGLGIGLIAITSFLAVEELFVFSLREDHPRSLYWLIAGLSVAGARFARLVPGRDAGPAADRDLPVRVATRAWRWLTPPLPPKRRVPAVRRVRPSAGAAFSLWREDLASVGRRRAGRRAALRAASGRESRRLPRWASGVVALAAAGSLLAGSGTVAARAEAGKLQVVLSLTDRASGAQGLYVANGDGSQIHPITSERDGSTYSFASWTPGGDRIVYAATHAGGPGQLFLAAGDGSLSVPMTNVPWQSGQPHMSPDGRSLLFTSASPEFPLYGLYRMDIATGLVTNLSQQFSTAGAADTDPSWSPDGRSIVFVQGAQVRGTGATTTPSQVYTMSAAGTGRVRVTNDSYYDVDPAYSPDGGTVAFSSYHGQHPGND